MSKTTKSNMNQLSLGIQLRDDANFDNWYIGRNQLLCAFLKSMLASPEWGFVYLWGNKGDGKSHLLQALVQMPSTREFSFYLPLGESGFSPEVLENLDHYDLICIDDVNCVAANPAWEEALFHLFNRCQSTARALVVSSNAPAAMMPLMLPDLKSRFASGLTYQIKGLNDEEKLAALQMRANNRGLVLGEEVGKYLLTHYCRATSELFNTLDRLDQASLQAKQRLTIPFVKTVLNTESTA